MVPAICCGQEGDEGRHYGFRSNLGYLAIEAAAIDSGAGSRLEIINVPKEWINSAQQAVLQFLKVTVESYGISVRTYKHD